MADRAKVHPVRVYVARSITEAELAVGYLEEQGIPAQVENPLSNETLIGLEPGLDEQGGIGVVVASDRAEQAVAALEDFDRGGPVDDEDGEDGPGDEDE